jgi:hypothetical protein
MKRTEMQEHVRAIVIRNYLNAGSIAHLAQNPTVSQDRVDRYYQKTLALTSQRWTN